MAYVMTVDQRHSRRDVDRVDAALVRLDRLARSGALAVVLPFERTAGDEFQGVLDDEVSVVTAILDLVRDGAWHIGVGAGTVDEPLPTSTRAARGSAFELARDAVEAAKHRPGHLAVRGQDPRGEQDADAVLALIAALVSRRTAAAWEAVDLLAQGLTTSEAAARLGISRQAVSQRLLAGLWAQEAAARPAAARLLARATGEHPATARATDSAKTRVAAR